MYAYGNPIRWIDPSGLVCEPPLSNYCGPEVLQNLAMTKVKVQEVAFQNKWLWQCTPAGFTRWDLVFPTAGRGVSITSSLLPAVRHGGRIQTRQI